MRKLASGCSVLVLLASSASAAVNLPREGKYDTTLCFGGPLPTMATLKTHMSGVLDLYGPMVGNLPGGGLYHLNSIRCTGVWAIIDGVYTENGYCETADPDGDKQFGQYANDGKGGKWQVLAGTGKYAGMSGSGVYGPVGQMAGQGDGTLVNCNRATGSYRLK